METGCFKGAHYTRSETCHIPVTAIRSISGTQPCTLRLIDITRRTPLQFATIAIRNPSPPGIYGENGFVEFPKQDMREQFRAWFI